MNVEQIIKEATRGIKDEWSLLHKIRYVYLKMGMLLQKDTDFFFSIDDKLEKENLSVSELSDIYDNLFGRDFRVICRSASYLLHKAYESIGINSKMVKSNNNVTNVDKDGESLVINHWMLAVSDETNTYFVSLASDLPYIQMGMRTRHFGTNIPYNKEDNEGNIIQVYEGDEIKHTVLDPTILENLDKDISYIKTYYPYDSENKDGKYELHYEDASFLLIRDSARNNKLYHEIEIEESFFYKSLYNFDGAYGRRVSLLDDSLKSLHLEDWDAWIKLLCEFVEDKINSILPISHDFSVSGPNWNYDFWIKNVCSKIQKFIFLQLNNGVNSNFEHLSVSDDFSYKSWSRKIKKEFNVPKNEYIYDSVLLILDKLNALVNYVKSDSDKKNFTKMFNSLSFHFIKPSSLYVNNLKDGYVSNYYIANKFMKVFVRHFGCNEYRNSFNDMDYSEQVVIIKEVISEMFPEINSLNCSNMCNYDERYSAILNRIQIYPIKNKKDGTYSIVFNVIGNLEDETDYYYFYNPKTNEFSIPNVFDLPYDYIIVSSRFKSLLDGVEDVEDFSGLKK
ncbi:MAG: hypothetical protein IJ475_00890 [Bacilli bacterium]|nr:hypothetical protein [Bacilli bacterium]